MNKILIIDDDMSVRESLKMVLSKDYEIFMASNGEEGIKLFKEESPDLVLLDIIMPGINGIEALKNIKTINKSASVVMLTATKMLKTAVEAMKVGASDYIAKPFDIEELRLIISNILANQEMEKEVRYLRSEMKKQYGIENIIGKSKVMKELYSKIALIADTKATVLITGESGTGKELVARALHYNSSKKNRPFIAINCAAIPDSLIESELFGHEKGAFTDAQLRREGQFELANNGTLFLDEIGDLSLATQSKILRIIQEREFTRVGGVQSLKVDVRLITATNKNLEESIKNKTFREDLYYRINVVPVYLPPLRERKEDIPLLINHFLKKISERDEEKIKEINNTAIELLTQYHWPGNIRELENIIEQVVALSTANIINPEDIPLHIRSQIRSFSLKEEALSGKISLEKASAEFEREIILEALRRTGYVQTHAAKILGITRRILKYKMDHLGIIYHEDEFDDQYGRHIEKVF